MKFRDLLDSWKQSPKPLETRQHYSIKLPIEDAARLQALAELHPGTDPERMVTDLLGAAIDEVEATMPYIPGSKVIREDDHGDPVYEDAGMTPKFLELTRKHRKTV